MATLRIITESQLIRGPLIGSGAFGTVFCGIWRPQQTSTNSTGSNYDSGLVESSQISLSPRTMSTSMSITETDWPDRLEVSWTESGRVLQVRRKSREITSSMASGATGSLPTPTESSVNRAIIEIPVAIKVLTDSADAQTNKELLEEAKVSLNGSSKPIGLHCWYRSFELSDKSAMKSVVL